MGHLHSKTLLEIHEDVPADHYDAGIRSNLFQKYWHYKRFKEVLNAIVPVEGNILDLGCHSGTFTSEILTKIKTKQVYGLDVSHSAIDLAKKRIPYGHFEVGDAVKLPYKNDYFDAVFCLEMLEHVDDPIAVINEVKRVIKKGARFYCLVPSDNRLFKLVWFLWTMYYPHWRHAHVQSYRQNMLEDVLTKCGFKIISVNVFHFGMLKLVVSRK